MCQTPSASVATVTPSLRPGISTSETPHGAPSETSAEDPRSASERTDQRDRRDRTECMMHLHARGNERGSDSALEPARILWRVPRAGQPAFLDGVIRSVGVPF